MSVLDPHAYRFPFYAATTLVVTIGVLLLTLLVLVGNESDEGIGGEREFGP